MNGMDLWNATIDIEFHPDTAKDNVEAAEKFQYLSPYARVFDFDNYRYRFDMKLNKIFLLTAQHYFNNELRYNGIVYLNDVYVYLGFEKVMGYERRVGWRLGNPEGDDYIDFGLFDSNIPEIKRYHKGCQPILLDFNASDISGYL